MPDLRTLAQAVVDARKANAEHRNHETYCAVQDAYEAAAKALGLPAVGFSAITAILAALNYADAQGHARAMGEVDGLLQQRVQAHRDAMFDRMSQWARDIRQGAREEATEIREWLSQRLPAAAEKEHG